MQEEHKKKDPYWLSHDCIDCIERYEDKMSRMRQDVRRNAQRIRDDYDMPDPRYERGDRNRCEHMDVKRYR
jgi:hypothetical protein